MTCWPQSLLDLALEELTAVQRESLLAHLDECSNCAMEYERLRLVRQSVADLPREDPPRRIVFVSDPILDTPWWRRVLTPAPGLAFASVLVAAAVVAHGWMARPVAGPGPSAQEVARQVEPLIRSRVDSAVREAIAVSETNAEVRLKAAVAQTRRDMDLEHRATMLAVEENFEVLRKQMNRLYVASNELGAGQ